MHPWLVEITGLERPQSSAGQLQSLWKSYKTEKISFWYRNSSFLAVQNSSIGLIVRPLVALAPLTIKAFTTLQSDPRDLWPLRHLIRVMRRHDLTKKDLPIYLPTYLPTYLPPYIPTLENTIQEPICQWHFHFSCMWAAVLFYTFDI